MNAVLPESPPREAVRRGPHPAAYALLYAPFGASAGFATVALAYLATRSGLTVQQGAEIVAVNLFPQTIKFFWSPVADITLSRRKWYVLSCLVCAASMFLCAAVPLGPGTFRLVEAAVLACSLASTFLGFALEALAAHRTTEGDRGRVGGWLQAGNVGGSGIGGGLGLWLLTHMASRWQAALIVGVLVLLCGAPIAAFPDVPAESSGCPAARAVVNVGRDLWSVLRSRIGVLSAVLCFVPLGTGSASGVLAQAEVAAFWHAGADEVAWVQGLVAGLISTAGCLIGGYLCNRLGGRWGYIVFGAAMGLVDVAMAWMPATPESYLVGSLAYSFTTGLCFAAFSAFVLEAIGAGNAATKYNAFASLSNFPIWYMGLLIAAAEARLGPRGMLLTEAVFAALGIAIFVAAASLPSRLRGTRPAALEASD